jgi:membrane dipeptidase
VDNGSPDYGLTKLGQSAVREMNRIGNKSSLFKLNASGMLVDISHVSNKTAHDVLSHSLAPPIFSHSSALALHRHERNVDDSVLKRLPITDGVVMVMFYKTFLTGDQDCSVDDVADHVLHIAHVAGWR